jgi:hypothetical protein
MLSLLILLATFAAFGVVFLKPKWGSFLIWMVLFTYPHNWWFQHQVLPMNIGVDDLFCIVLFLVVLIRRNLLGGIPIRFGYALWAITAFVCVGGVAILSGSLDAPAFELAYYIKDVLKLCVYWGLFYAILHCIDDHQDLRRQFTMFAVAAVIGGLIVILHGLFPGRMQSWSNPLLIDIEGVTGRATGAFLNANGAACVLACSLALIVTAIRLQHTLAAKLMMYLFCAVLMVGILVTRSRSGLLALAGTVALMAFFGHNRRVAWMIILAGLAVGILFSGMRQAVQQRVAVTYDSAGGWGKNVTGRFDTWKGYFETATPKTYLLGQGHRAGIARNGSETHSAYVAVITVYGVGGVIWALSALIGFLRRALKRDPWADPLIAIVKGGCLWALVTWVAYALTADALSSQYPRYLLFYLVVLLDRAAFIGAEESECIAIEDELAYLDQLAEPSVDEATAPALA